MANSTPAHLPFVDIRLENSTWRQMKENYQIYLPYQFRLRAHSVDREPEFPHGECQETASGQE